MKHLQTPAQFQSEKKIDEVLDIVENEISELEGNEEINEEELITEGAFWQVMGYLFALPWQILRQTIRFFKKKQKIRNAMEKIDDPAKKEALKKQLEKLKYEEVRAKEKMEEKKEELEAKKKELMAAATPEEKAKAAKAKEKADKKLAKAKADFEKEKKQFHGFEV
tara:strand:- start:48 stop:545 length:498 start_codon:yes stop_codon:yes gene_type:complete